MLSAIVFGAALLAQASPAPAGSPPVANGVSPAGTGSAQYIGTRIALPKSDKAPAIDGTLSDPLWQQVAAKAQLGWNLRDQQPAAEPTTVYVLTDGKYLYVAFDAQQHQPVQAGQHTNDAGLGSNDTVTVYFWPNGSNGFQYSFSANPIGTHVAYSSENSSYAPSWQSAGRVRDGGFTVTMRIPLNAIKGGSSADWGLQFARYISLTQDDYVWQHASQQGSGNEANSIYSGYLAGVPAQGALRPRPRIGVYGLAELASSRIGGSTSRIGADLSIPVTASTSFVATLHPDYSNVELDQQTIQPTAYARFFQEVRPFFTQLDNFFNDGSCVGCTGQEFYSPFIPTPRAGFALEGKQGPASFAAFDSIGINGRRDIAQAVRLKTNDTKTALFLQHVGVSLPGLFDSNTFVNLAHDSTKGLFEYLTYGTESGTQVTDPGQAKRREAGIGLYGRNGGVYFALRHLGSQYAPFDGLFQQSDVAGYDLNTDYTWYYKSSSFFPRVIVAADIDRYHGTAVGLNQSDTSLAAGADIKKLWHIRLQTGSSYLRLGNGVFTPVTQNGIDLYFGYHTPTTTQLSWYTGRFGPGRLDSWTRATTLKAGPRGYISLLADSNTQWLDGGGRNVSWLEKMTYTYQNGSDSSIGVGLRRIIGAFPVVAGGPARTIDGWNVSFAYHKRMPHAELYLVYGDANAFETAPRFVIKLIEYAGADKGT